MTEQPLTVSTTYAQLLIDTLEEKGIDISGDDFGILRQGDDPSSSIAFHNWMELLNKAAFYTKDSAISLAVGQRIKPHNLGILGYALMASSTLGELIRRYARYHVTVVKGFPIELKTGTKTSTLSWPIPTSYPTFQSNVCAVTAMLTQIRHALGQPAFMPVSIGFVDKKPVNLAVYQKVLGSNLTFNNPVMSFTINNDMLETQLVSADANLVSVLHKSIEKLLPKNEPAKHTELLIKMHHILAECLGRTAPSIDMVAGKLNLSKRTLSRRLGDLNTSFRVELGKVQQELAQSYLKDGRFPLVDIAQLVGFEDQSSFTRAFKKWCGLTPGLWQSQQSK